LLRLRFERRLLLETIHEATKAALLGPAIAEVSSKHADWYNQPSNQPDEGRGQTGITVGYWASRV